MTSGIATDSSRFSFSFDKQLTFDEHRVALYLTWRVATDALNAALFVVRFPVELFEYEWI
jgi:hypothetical protein